MWDKESVYGWMRWEMDLVDAVEKLTHVEDKL